MADEKVERLPYQHPKFKTLADMAIEAAGAPAAVLRQIEFEAEKQAKISIEEKNGKAKPTQVPTDKQLGRICVFKPTKEKVTVVREKVGKSYNDVWIHEVVSREGKKFLASEIQLRNLV